MAFPKHKIDDLEAMRILRDRSSMCCGTVHATLDRFVQWDGLLSLLSKQQLSKQQLSHEARTWREFRLWALKG